MASLGFYKVVDGVELPKFQTAGAACFDLQVCCFGKSAYTGFNSANKPINRPLHKGDIHIMPGDRIMIPTGLILDIPAGYSVRLHPRSGLSLKSGLVLANCEAVIDEDYIEELFVLLYNQSENGIWVRHGDRVAQAELVKSVKYDLTEIKEKPIQKTDRVGGLGSTGVNDAGSPPGDG